MADVFTRRRRSEIMGKVRSSGNASTEGRMVRLLRRHRVVGWRRGSRLIGSPDFVWRGKRIVLFVDGCFWHGCPSHAHTPRSHQAYWKLKIARNKTRDRRVRRSLRQLGWIVLRIWEHELAQKNEARLLRKMRRAFGENSWPAGKA